MDTKRKGRYIACTETQGAGLTDNQQGAMTMMTAAAKTYAYAVVRSQGMYDSGDVVPVARLTDDLEAARKFAQRCSDDYKRGMRPYGGSSGGYRVIPWGSADRTISGYALDRTPDAK